VGPITSVGKVGGGWISLGMDGQEILNLRTRLL